jgi:hypothetical protein
LAKKLRMKLNSETQELTINGKTIDLELLAMLCDPRPRLLWRFQQVDGEVRAIPYDESKVIWIDPTPELDPE